METCKHAKFGEEGIAAYRKNRQRKWEMCTIIFHLSHTICIYQIPKIKKVAEKDVCMLAKKYDTGTAHGKTVLGKL